MRIIQTIVTNTLFQRLVSKQRLSRFVGWLANRKLPDFILNWLIQKFVKSYPIRLENILIPDGGFKTFNAFFTRKLKLTAGLFHANFCSPVEGQVSQYGEIHNQSLYQMKGNLFSLQKLCDHKITNNFSHFITIYLSPANYHRVHAPCDLQIQAIHHIAGDAWSTSASSLARVEEVYCKNHRILLECETIFGNIVLILVGAILVNHIHLAVCETPDAGNSAAFVRPIVVQKGAEIGYFSLGSTVMILSNFAFRNIAWGEINLGEELKK